MSLEPLFSAKTENHYTPLDFFADLHLEFAFTTDPCTNKHNHLGMAVFFTKETDGLKNLDKWEGNVFINPPYGPDIKHWLAAAKQYAEAGRGIVVLLLPARTDTRWFHEYVYQKPNVEVRFLKGRLRFVTPEGKQEGSAPFPSMLAIFTPPESCRSNPADFQKIDAWDLDKLVL